MSLEAALQSLRLEPRFMQNVARWATQAARPAQGAPFPPGLDERLIAVLAARGIAQLYSHQAEAVTAGLTGAHVAVVTAAASGKTLCYNLPTLQRLLADGQARALYLFPTKALAQDQLAELRDLIGQIPAPALAVATYDGDTPPAQRPKVRDAARIILSNPDMLHAGILPQHTRWAGFFANLRVVVLDEMHVYRGVFGSHIANVLRRLRRICRFYGNSPQFILTSATIANPSELAERLTEAPVTLIGPERDGAPRGVQHTLFYNPPLLDAALGIRQSSSQEATALAAHFLAHDVQTIVFARARLTAELILAALRDTAGVAGEPDRGALRAYRGGYLPAVRREIERGLRAGQVRGVVATNALELGIDIGRLDAAVLAGYPGTIASTRQQMGRAGRRQGASVALLVAGDGALDQYIMAHGEFLERTPEHARLNPDNEVILAGHLLCAAAELPLGAGEGFGSTPAEQVAGLLDDLVQAGQLYRTGGRFFWAGEGSPSAALGLRSASPDRVLIHTPGEDGQPQLIGELDRPSALRLLYEGAIYLHEGATYRVERLDWEGGSATVRPAAVDFYTRPVVGEKIEVLRVREASAALAWGDVRVISQVSGYKQLSRASHEVLGLVPLTLPEQVLETQACWLTLGEALVEGLRSAGAWASDVNDYGPRWPATRAAVRARDGFRCQGCGAAETDGRQHDVHHRIPFRAFAADPALRGGLPVELAWQAANRLENLVTLCPACHRRAEASVRLHSGLGGAAALLAGVAPLFLMCDPRDLGVIAEPADPTSGRPSITLYDQAPGGVGYAEQIYRAMPDLLAAAHDLVAACPCTYGCPACVGPVLEHDTMLDTKLLAAALLAALRGEVKSG